MSDALGGRSAPRDVRNEGRIERLPSLRAEDLGEANFAVLTVADVVDGIPVTKPDGRRKFSMRLKFQELPDRHWWPNETSRKVLYRMLGPDVRTWIGRSVVLEVVQTETPPPESMPVLSVWAAPPADWRGHLAAYKEQQAERTTPPEGGGAAA
jgi:hypothetical protein